MRQQQSIETCRAFAGLLADLGSLDLAGLPDDDLVRAIAESGIDPARDAAALIRADRIMRAVAAAAPH